VTASETFVPASSNGRHNTVSVVIGQSESLEDGVPEVSPVVLMLGADDAELMAGGPDGSRQSRSARPTSSIRSRGARRCRPTCTRWLTRPGT